MDDRIADDSWVPLEKIPHRRRQPHHLLPANRSRQIATPQEGPSVLFLYEQPVNQLSPLQVLMSCFGLASFAGLASLLRSGRQLTLRAIAAAMLYSGLSGLIIGLVWFRYYAGDDPNFYFLIGISGLAGMGGASFLDFLVQALRKGGVRPPEAN